MEDDEERAAVLRSSMQIRGHAFAHGLNAMLQEAVQGMAPMRDDQCPPDLVFRVKDSKAIVEEYLKNQKGNPAIAAVPPTEDISSDSEDSGDDGDDVEGDTKDDKEGDDDSDEIYDEDVDIPVAP
mmetsp:Transcript_5282/g.11758  ORF Transcript_5282/g.11758 Transcript_5282/m.11758 type:complete len:125 (-) Transcript_5282:39-413(-)